MSGRREVTEKFSPGSFLEQKFKREKVTCWAQSWYVPSIQEKAKVTHRKNWVVMKTGVIEMRFTV